MLIFPLSSFDQESSLNQNPFRSCLALTLEGCFSVNVIDELLCTNSMHSFATTHYTDEEGESGSEESDESESDNSTDEDDE